MNRRVETTTERKYETEEMQLKESILLIQDTLDAVEAEIERRKNLLTEEVRKN